ncbi:hypothetical protein [Rhodococcoides fascians]|uniref:hypothetical protein n=1 Tax=Rhodococcoides fascians TaxID=1828 RepID=UPI00117A8E52|nr:hypothetical protein [Rhodococcus fascians]
MRRSKRARGTSTPVGLIGGHHEDFSERAVSHAIGVARILWGATTTVASRQVYNALGVRYPSSDLGIWIKAFGVRDVALGAAALHPDLTVRRLALRAGIVIDLIDAAVVSNAARRGLPRRAAVVGLAFAGGTAAFGPRLVGKLCDGD